MQEQDKHRDIDRENKLLDRADQGLDQAQTALDRLRAAAREYEERVTGDYTDMEAQRRRKRGKS